MAALLSLVVVSVVQAEEMSAPILDQPGKTYGRDSWDQIEAIRFTFNLESPKLSRSWVWEPKADRISYDGPDKDGKPIKVTYSHSQLPTQSAFVKERVDPAFINDQHALLLPFFLASDTGVTVEDAGMQKGHLLRAPPGRSWSSILPTPAATRLMTPGSSSSATTGGSGRLCSVTGGTVKPAVSYATWADHKQVGPLLISMDKRGTGDGHPIHLFFTHVAVKLVGSSTWIDTK